MLKTYEQAKNFHHKQLGGHVILQDAFSIHAFVITSFKGFEPNTLEYVASIDKHEHPEVQTYDNAYDVLLGTPTGTMSFVKAVKL